MISGSTTPDLEGREHEEASPQAYTLHTGVLLSLAAAAIRRPQAEWVRCCGGLEMGGSTAALEWRPHGPEVGRAQALLAQMQASAQDSVDRRSTGRIAEIDDLQAGETSFPCTRAGSP